MTQQGRLPRYLCAAWALLTLYVCLFPFTAWTDSGVSPWAFLTAPWPKYNQPLDNVLNVLGFMPLGFFFAAAVRGGWRGGRILGAALLLSALLSFGIEFLQNYLPTRVASNLDLAANTLGGTLGAWLGVRWGGVFLEGGRLQRWRMRYVMPGRMGELGMLLLALWWLAQLAPGMSLFGTGDLKVLFDLPAALAFSAQRFMWLELAIAASSTLALGLLLLRCMRETRFLWVLLAFVVALGLRSLADYVFLASSNPLHWASLGGLRGLVLGLALLAVASRLPRWSQHSLASFTLLLSTALVNLAPENPFVDASARLLQKGHYLNFYGLTQWVSVLWPFLALVYLSAQASVRRPY